MNKKSFIIVTLLVLMTVSLKAQWFDFSNNYRASLGLNLGVVGYDLTSQGIDKTLAGFGAGANLSICGIYIDFIYQQPEHRYTQTFDLGQPDWDDHTALSINVGYQIPVLPWLYLTPMVGYSNETVGKTSVSILEIEDKELVHKYTRTYIDNFFNYGLGLMIRPVEFIEIGAVATSHAIYGTISYSSNMTN